MTLEELQSDVLIGSLELEQYNRLLYGVDKDDWLATDPPRWLWPYRPPERVPVLQLVDAAGEVLAAATMPNTVEGDTLGVEWTLTLG